MKKLTVSLLFLLAAGIMSLQAQKTISGTVTSSEDGSSVPGASIIVKGTTTGTISSAEGTYTLKVPDDAQTLVVSFIGMKTIEVAIEGKTTVDIVMEPDVMGLDEVVVTALGITKDRKALGYSVQDVSSDEISKTVNANVVNSLAGKVAGVQITSSTGAAGASSYITMRGPSSILLDNQPLFVVDGVPIDNSQDHAGNPDAGRNNFNDGVAYSNRAIDLNPDDIENISVLKGGAATALYGLRAANGVVMITTKKGKAGVGKPLTVQFNTSVSIDQITTTPPLQNKFSQGYGGVWAGPPSALTWGAKIDTLAWDGATDYKWDKNGQIVSQNDPSAAKNVVPYDNVDDFFQTGITYKNSLSLSGGDEKTSFYSSISHLTQTGVVPNNTFDKTTFKISGESKLSDKFKLIGSANYINSGGDRIQQGSNTSGIMLGLLRTPPTFDNSNGVDDPVNTLEAYEFPDGGQRTYRGGGGYDNPYWSVNKNILSDDVNRLIGHVGFSWTANDWLTITYRAGTDVYSDRKKYHFGIGSRNYPAGQVVEDQRFTRDINSDLLAIINKELGSGLEINATLGQNMFSHEDTRLYSQGDGLTVPDYYHSSNAASFLLRETLNRNRTAAFFGDIGIVWNSMVFLNVTGRNEWSTTLPTDANSNFYPSVSGAFEFTQLGALQDNPILSYGKLRVSQAKTAIDATIYSTGDYWDIANFGDGWTNGVAFPFTGVPGFTFNDVSGSPDLRPEITKSFEVGADLRFLNGLASVDVAYYNNVSEDILLSVPTSGTAGVLSVYKNAASMENKGIELLLTVAPIRSADLNWTLTFNFAQNKNTITELAPGVENVSLGGFTGSQIRAVAGGPYGDIYGDSWLRYDENGDERSQPEEPIIIIDDPDAWNYGYPEYSAEEIVVGNIQPDWTGGVVSNLSYKDISFSFTIDIRQGNEMWNGTRGALRYFGMHKDTETRDTETKVFEGYKGHWDPTTGDMVYSGEKNDIESPLNQGWYIDGEGSGFTGPTEQFIDDASWVRLKEINLSYDLSSVLKNTFLRNGAEVYVSGRNLWLSTPYEGVDPETSLYGADRAQGMDYFNMPGTRSYTFGLRLSF